MFFSAGTTRDVSTVTKPSNPLLEYERTLSRQYNSLMRALRYLYVLALVMWLGGMFTAGLIVAPTTFGVLEGWDPAKGRMLAGQVFGAVLSRFHLLAYGAALVMVVVLTLQRLLGPRPKAYGIRVGLLGVMLAATFYSGSVLAPQIDQLQVEVNGPMTELPETDPRRAAFDGAHRLSTMLFMATMVGGLILLGWESREHA
jgi:hypothetical protein